MENEQTLQKVAQFLKSKVHYSKITDYLISENIPESEHDEIIKKAKNLIFEEKIPEISKKNKIKFGIYLCSTLIVFLIFVAFLPEKVESEATFLSILGAFLISFLGLITYANYDSWNPDLIKIQQRPNIDYGLLVLLTLIPSIILFFIISAVFESKAEELLKKNQIEVTGKIVSGGETEYSNIKRSIKISNIVVEFKTLEGEIIIASEDVSNYEFKNFYLNQDINLIYSKTNPKNISLLTNESNITKFKETEEKEILPSDLISLVETKSDNYEKALNRISYGWKFNSEEKLWVNERKDIAIGFKNNSVIYISKDPIILKYHLEKQGFKSINEAKKDIVSQISSTGIYKKDNYIVSIEGIQIENGEMPLTIATLSKIK